MPEAEGLIPTVSVDKFAFRIALRRFVLAALGGAFLFSMYRALGHYAVDSDVKGLAAQTAEHYSRVPVIAPVIAMIAIICVQFGGLGFLSGWANRGLTWSLTLVVESLSHAFSTVVGIASASSVWDWHRIGALVYLHNVKIDPIFALSFVSVTAVCGYWAAILAEANILVDGRKMKALGYVSASVFLLMGIGLML